MYNLFLFYTDWINTGNFLKLLPHLQNENYNHNIFIIYKSLIWYEDKMCKGMSTKLDGLHKAEKI